MVAACVTRGVFEGVACIEVVSADAAGRILIVGVVVEFAAASATGGDDIRGWERAGDLLFVPIVELPAASEVSLDGSFIVDDTVDGVGALDVDSDEVFVVEAAAVVPLFDVVPVEGVRLDGTVVVEIVGTTTVFVYGDGRRTPAPCILVTHLYVTEGGGQAFCSVHSKKAFRVAEEATPCCLVAAHWRGVAGPFLKYQCRRGIGVRSNRSFAADSIRFCGEGRV